MARPELLDRRPAWGGGKLNATNVLLEPLAPEEAERADRAELDERIDRRAARADPRGRGGNPLFVEEMVAMAEDAAARSSCRRRSRRCSPRGSTSSSRPSAACSSAASVEGLVFHRGAVAALAPEEPTVDGRLITLVRKDLVRPEPAACSPTKRRTASGTC